MAKSSVLCMVIFRREITIQEYLSAECVVICPC